MGSFNYPLLSSSSPSFSLPPTHIVSIGASIHSSTMGVGEYLVAHLNSADYIKPYDDLDSEESPEDILEKAALLSRRPSRFWNDALLRASSRF